MSADSNRRPDVETRLRQLEGQVHELRSINEIQQLHHTYIRCLAGRDWQGCVDCYAEDAVCDIRSHGVRRGKREIAQMILGELAPMVRSHDAYMLTSPNITVDGDRATGEWTWHRFQCEFRTGLGWMRVWGPWSEGRYRCEYVREDGTWKFGKVWFRVLLPDADESLQQLGEDEVIGSKQAWRPAAYAVCRVWTSRSMVALADHASGLTHCNSGNRAKSESFEHSSA